MKRLFNTLIMLLIAIATNAQAPQGIPYQAVARNSAGSVLAATAISVRFTIRDSIATGVIKYQETHSVTTTAQGMFNVNVGQGSPLSGTFSSINWGTNAKFMQVEMDPAGGISYIEMGTQQMLSVPYALSAGALKLTVSTTGDTLYSGCGNFVIIPGISAANCALPNAGTITGTPTVTAGSTTTLSNTNVGGTWSSSAPSIAIVGSSGVVTGIAAGTATVSYTVTNSCGSVVVTREVTVNAAVSLTIGTSYGGGKIFYILLPGDPGYIAGETHGLIAMNSNLSSQWGPTPIFFGATGITIGTGNTNTNTIVGAFGLSYTAAGVCRSYSGDGFTDWFLPSKDELEIMYTKRVLLSMVGNYWSSTESSSTNAWIKNFSTGTGGYGLKGNSLSVRAIRSF